MIEWQSVSKAFAGRTALDSLSLQVEPGEVFGFLGPNGAGKTTALRIAAGLVLPDRGKVLMGGIPAARPEARRSMVYLPEEIRFAGAFRLGEWLRYQVGLRGGVQDRVEKAAHRVGLSSRIDSPVSGFSKGMRRRAGLALLVACRPTLWLLDEPTADLDVEGRDLVENILLEAKGEGAAIFLSSHILSDVERVCDRVGVIDRGRLVKSATPAELLPEPFLVDITLSEVPEDPARLAGGRQHLFTPEARRLRVFVPGREEGNAVVRGIEEGGIPVVQSTFRPASLRDAIRSILP